MKLVTAEEIQELDRQASEAYGIPSIVLMENAGLRIFDEARRILENLPGKRVLIFAGKGNNGGDGFVVARHLLNAGAEVKVFLLAGFEDIQGDARTNLTTLQKIGCRIFPLLDEKELQRVDISLLYADLVVDSIFGTGFKGAVRGISAQVIERINNAGKVVIAADLPSGLEANTGRVYGPCIKATTTVTLGLPKIGLYLEPGAGFCGDIRLGDISFPREFYQKNIQRRIITRSWCAERLFRRQRDTHKGDYGKVFVLGGSGGMTGAVLMAAHGALRAGAGLVYLGVPRSLQTIVEMKTTEVITYAFSETEQKTLSVEALEAVLELVSSCSVLALGPGMGRHPDTTNFLQRLLTNLEIPVIIDADGLNALAEVMDILEEVRCPLVLTPHPGEMARLTGKGRHFIQKDRLRVVENAAALWKCVVVLKGAKTLVATPEGEVYLNITGNPGMATGGSGDVLTGVIAAFIGQGLSPVEAAVLGTYVHGTAGDLGSKIKGERGLTAGDIIDFLPKVLKDLEE